MTALRLTAFQGEQPQVQPRLLPESGAQSAVDVRLDDGALTPVRRPVQATTLAAAGKKTIYKHGDTWLGWDIVVHPAPGPVDDDRLYYTGDGAPKVIIDGNTYDLAVPCPTTAPTASVTGAGTGDVITRTYVYTWVTAFGEESEPSPACEPTDWQPGQTFTLTDIEDVPAGRNITRQRFYRSQTGQSGTYLYFIAERDADNADYVDDVGVDDFQEALPSVDWNAPPDGLSGLVSMPNGMMAAFKGRDVYFCEPFIPHAWPEKYVLTTDSDVVGLGALGTSLVILTTGNPYLAAGSAPESMQMEKLQANLPCINARGIVDMGFAIAYPSNEGLVAVQADGSIGIRTENLFDRDKWLELAPDTFLAGQVMGRYAAFVDTIDKHANTVAYVAIIDIGATPFVQRSQARATAVYFDIASSGLYYQSLGEKAVYRLDDPSGARQTMYWRSKKFVLPAPGNFGAIRVDADTTLTVTEQANYQALLDAIAEQNAELFAAGDLAGAFNATAVNTNAINGDILLPKPPPLSGSLTIGIYADGKRVATISRHGKALRLPAGFKARVWEVDVAGDIQVQEIKIASTMDELKQVQ